MDRRKSLKLIATGAIASGAVVAGCNAEDQKKPESNEPPKFNLDRFPDEVKHEQELIGKEDFFNAQEMTTIALLCDIIIPRDEISGSATDAKVPAFIAFIVKDMPHYQVPLRGGLRWLDMQCLNQYEKSFKDCSQTQQMEMVDKIAWPDRVKNKKELAPGVSFFSLLRNLTATGFYTSEIGVKDMGYMGNVANKWNGVPEEVLKQYNLAYTEKELKECVSFDNKTA